MKPIAALVLLALAGCGTLEDIDARGPFPFGGVSRDFHYIRGGDCHVPGFVYVPDVPLSLALDVALLPISIPFALLSGPEDKEAPE